MSCTTPLIIRPTSAFSFICVELVRITELNEENSVVSTAHVCNTSLYRNPSFLPLTIITMWRYLLNYAEEVLASLTANDKILLSGFHNFDLNKKISLNFRLQNIEILFYF